MSVGNSGGGESGYCFAVQSYCPPRVTHRIFRCKSCVIDRGRWISGSLGVARGIGYFGEMLKKDFCLGDIEDG